MRPIKYPVMQKGEKYGRLTVLEVEGIYVLCVCDCGKRTKTYVHHLRTGKTRSCGCLRKEMLSKCYYPEILGKRFSKLVAVDWLGIQPYNGKRGSVWRCKCDCGGTKDIPECQLKDGKVRSCGCLSMNFVNVGGTVKSLTEWGNLMGISRQRAHQLFKSGNLERRILAISLPQ